MRKEKGLLRLLLLLLQALHVQLRLDDPLPLQLLPPSTPSGAKTSGLRRCCCYDCCNPDWKWRGDEEEEATK